MAVEENFSEKSVTKMKNIATEENMGKSIVEIAAIAEAGKLFCESTYLKEGDNPLVFGAHLQIAKLEEYITTGPNFGVNSRTKKRCREAAVLVNDLCKDLVNAGNSLSEQVSVLNDELAVMQQQQRDMNANMENVRSGSRTRGHCVELCFNGKHKNC